MDCSNQSSLDSNCFLFYSWLPLSAFVLVILFSLYQFLKKYQKNTLIKQGYVLLNQNDPTEDSFGQHIFTEEELKTQSKNLLLLSLTSIIFLFLHFAISLNDLIKTDFFNNYNYYNLFQTSALILSSTWLFFFISMVTFMLKLTDFPSAASIFYVAVLLLDLIQSRTTDKYLHLSKAAISLVLIWLDFYLRKHQTYFEPAPATDGYRHKSLEMKAGILSILTFNWLTPLISVGNKRILTEDDLWELNECDLSENSLARFQEVKKNSKTKNLYLLILYTIWKPFILQLIFGMVETALGLSGPFFLNKILKWIQCKEDTAFGGWGFLAAMFSCSIIKTLVDGQLQFSARRMGIQVRSILVGEIYGKSLRRAIMANLEEKIEEDIDKEAAKIEAFEEPDEKTALLPKKDEKKKEKEKKKKDEKNKEKKPEDKKAASIGKIVTLISVDTEDLRQFLSFLYSWSLGVPLSAVLSFIGLWMLVGYATLAGVGTLLLIAPLTTYLTKRAFHITNEMMEIIDERVTKTNEILQGIRIVKYFAWESDFINAVESIRQRELKKLVLQRLTYMGFNMLTYGGGVLVTLVTFATYTMVMGKTLDAATAYTAYSLLDRLTMDLGEIPDIIAYVLEVKIAGDRIISFLKEPELEKYSIESPEIVQALSDASNTFVGEPKVGFGNARFMYHGSPVENDESKEDDNASTKSGSRGNAAFVLRDIDVEFPIGKLTTICGATGAGKSTLIQALFGELNRLHGEVHLPDPRHHAFAEVNPLSGLVPTGVAYVAQSAWMLNSTIRDNILFGQPYEEKRYYQVLEACALKKDLESLEAGDMTEIGEKGINISGGQKQRISIARAAYSPYSFVVLDDPLSAVDAPTARHILNSCILGPIMKGRTIVLVSHGVGLVLPKSDYVVVLRNGTITAKGTPLELSMGDHLQGIVSDEILSRGSDWLFEAKQENLNDKDRVEETTEENTERKLTGKLVQDEEKSEGAVKLQVYYSYLKSAGGIKFGLLFLCSILLKFAANMAHSWWLKVWSDAGAAANPPVCNVPSNTSPLTPLAATTPVHSGNPKEFDLMYYVLYYALFATSTLIAANLKTCLYIFGQIRAAKIVHSRLLETVLGAPLRFFEITPVGRILNRFSKDIKTVDANVMVMANNFLTLFGEVVQILIVISFFNYTFVILIIPVMVIYFFIANQYLNVSRELKRFEAITRSPVYSQFSESLTGVSTIRGYGHEKRFTKNMLRSVDKNHRTFFYLWAAVRWLSVRTEMISSLVVLAAGCAMLYNNVEASTAGFCLSYALEFNWKLFFTIRSHAELEMGMNAVERIDEYTVLEQEAPAVIDTYRPAPDWPSAGVVTVKNLSIRYAPELPEVLKNLSFQSKRFEKIGVVGRTGAGKSTLSLAFFRIVPFAGGSIDIDGMDISKLGLKDLRSKLTIIPQDPVLFTGTLRSNLDPVGKHDDVEIWSVLKRVHFFESLQDDEEFEPVASSSVSIASSCSRTSVYSSNLSAKQSSNLESKVTENGNNYSHGQRQLLCLARALLRRSKVIILDEATASVDNTTDAKIQETIREEFKENTLFCIAHRLRTVVDYDRILVLDQGQVAEFDTPLALIEKNGIFRSMCEESGEFNELFNIAKNSAK